MVDVTGFLKKIGFLKEAKPKVPAAAPSANAGMAVPKAGVPGVKKGFDVNLYMKAVGMFFSDFFGKKLPYFFKNIGPVMKNFPSWWGKLPQDEQISYGVLALGHVMFVVGIVLFVVV